MRLRTLVAVAAPFLILWWLKKRQDAGFIGPVYSGDSGASSEPDPNDPSVNGEAQSEAFTGYGNFGDSLL
jgi:hypothetical protein